jgi:MYXO-CTERM domain-containing protein
MKRALLVSALLVSSLAWADVPPGPPGCDCTAMADAPLAMLAVLAGWVARRRR